MRKLLLCLSMAIVFCIVTAGCRKDDNDNGVMPEVYETDPPVFKPVTQKVNDLVGGYYRALPARYSESSRPYPLLLFLHGGGQFGNGSYDLPLLLNEGIPQLLDEKKFPADFVVDGSHYSFIVLAPQFTRVPDDNAIASFLDHAAKTYRIDSTRIYVCGFSLGGRMAFDFGAAFANKLAAIVPISGAPNYDLVNKSQRIAQANLPVWAFHNRPDALFSMRETKDFVDMINGHHPMNAARLTIFPDSTGLLGHDAWSRATHPSYKENNRNIYEWMLQYKKH
ncbi:MAG TPA: dienelactone hydrolase family protein [Chitinophagaceae bacterium]|nr:dienelactone hydrolase family protein [Chitinophagaceae bacterium]